MSDSAPLSSQNAESGVVVEFVPSVTQPIVPSDVRTLGLIGKGQITKAVLSYTATRGVTPDSVDTLAPAASSLPLNVIDENMISYALNVDYLLTGGNVDWSPSNPATFTSSVSTVGGLNVTGLTLILYVNGGTAQTVTFTGVNPIARDGVGGILDQINVAIPTISATASGNFIKIATITTNNATLQIGDGTANSVIGFVGGLLSVGPKEPAASVKYAFDYQTAKLTSDYIPKFFSNLDDVVAEYGAESTSNTLTLGASIAFQNSAGTGGIWAIQLNPAITPDLAGFRDALNKLARVERLNIVIPLTGDSYFYQDVKQHVVNSSAPLEKKERTSILGMQGNPTLAQSMSYASGLAAGGNGRRLLLIYPPSATRIVGGTLATLNGSFVAAAIGGLRINSNYDVAEPLLRKPLLGFEEIQTGLTRTEKLMLRNAGVTVIEMIDGVVRITEDTTVDRTTPDNQEYTVTEIVDFTANTTRRLIDAIFIGIKLLPDTPNLVVATLNVILSTLVDLHIINSFQKIKAGINSIDPRQIDISFSIQPTRTLRFIKITFSI